MSVLDTPQFRELTGEELLEVLAQELSANFKEEMRKSNRFNGHNAYPVVRGELKFKVYPDRPLPEEVVLRFEIGTNHLNAPDRVRKEHGLTVLQPQKIKGVIKNMPVEAE